MDISEGRLADVADRFGFKEGIKAGEGALAEIDRLTGGDRYDIVFDATGSARAMEGSFAFVASGGTLVFVGVEERRHHLQRPGTAPEGNDPEGDAERHPRRFRRR